MQVVYIYAKLAASSGPTVCLHHSALSDSKYHHDKRFVLYMYSIKGGSQKYSVTLYSQFTSYNIILE